MKIVRGYENDLIGIAELHRLDPLDLGVLLERFRDEMRHVIKPGSELKLNLVVAVEKLFGAVEADRVEAMFHDWDIV